MKCCEVVSGPLTSVSETSISISHPTPDGKIVEQQFAVDRNTVKNAKFTKGSQATVYFDKSKNLAKRVTLTEALEGLLIPANEPDPPNPCWHMTIPNEALKMFLGNTNLVWTTGTQAVVLRFGKQEVLSIRRTDKGAAVSAKVFSEDGKVVAQIVDNQFYINPNNFFRKAGDKHSLVVYDLEAQEVLRVRYLNTLSFKVTGVFYSVGMQRVLISEDVMMVGKSTLQHVCGGNVGTFIAVE